MSTANQTTLRFFYNGIKGTDGRLQKCSYSDGQLCHFPAGTITIYGRDYSGFSAEVRKAFTVVNDSDGMTDYFENDRIRVELNHPLYAVVAAALAKQTEKREARFGRYLTREGVA